MLSFLHFDPSDPTTRAQIGGLIRSLIIMAGGLGLTGDQTSQIAGALAVVVGVLWSLWQKHSSDQAHQATTATVANAVAANPQNVAATLAAAKATPQNVTAIRQAARTGQF